MSTISSLSSQSAAFTLEDLKKMTEEQNQKKEESQRLSMTSASISSQATLQANSVSSQNALLQSTMEKASNNTGETTGERVAYAKNVAANLTSSLEHESFLRLASAAEDVNRESQADSGESVDDDTATSSGEIKVAESTSAPSPKKLAKPKVESVDIVV